MIASTGLISGHILLADVLFLIAAVLFVVVAIGASGKAAVLTSYTIALSYVALALLAVGWLVL